MHGIEKSEIVMLLHVDNVMLLRLLGENLNRLKVEQKYSFWTTHLRALLFNLENFNYAEENGLFSDNRNIAVKCLGTLAYRL